MQAMYWSPQDTRDRFDLSDLYSAQDSFAWPRVDLARPLRLVDVRPFWISLSKSAGFVSLLSRESFIGFNSTSGAILFLRS